MITSKKSLIESFDKEIKKESIEITKVKEKIAKIEIIIKEIEKRNKFKQEYDNIPLQIENIDLKINQKNDLLKRYDINIIYIEENKKVQSKIDTYKSKVDELINENDYTNVSSIINELVAKENQYICPTSINIVVNTLLKNEVKTMVDVINILHDRKNVDKILENKKLPIMDELKFRRIIENNFTNDIMIIDINKEANKIDYYYYSLAGNTVLP